MVSNGIEIAKRALLANKYAMDVIGHNIANVNTEGYSRQRVELATSDPVSIPVINKNKPMASLGTGVQLQKITRFRDDFLDAQKRDVTRDYGRWEQEAANYTVIEGIINEPSDLGLSSDMNKFWNSWQALANPDPSDVGARSAVQSQASIMAQSMRETRRQLVDLQVNNDKDIELKVEKINQLASQIAAFNGQIVETEAASSANDLRDSRNKIVTDLSKLINLEYYENSNGSSTIAIGGAFLVSDRYVNNLAIMSNASNKGYNDVVWENNGDNVAIDGGEIYGLIKSRDVNVQGFVEHLDAMASMIINRVNNIHTTGYDMNGELGGNFFEGTNASDIALNDEISFNLSKIASAGSKLAVAGDGDNALLLAGLRNDLVFDSNSTNIDEYYQNLVSSLGTNSSEVNTFLSTTNSLLQQVDKQINSVSGVSIDEEMAEMIKFEHAYNAAAKYISTINGTLDTLMGMLR